MRRVRLAHSKAHSALDDVSNGEEPTGAATSGSSGGAQLAAMQKEHTRMAWDLSVLKRSMPELEAAADLDGGGGPVNARAKS